MRYFVRLSYLGAPFHGWQSQPNAVSVQSTIEDALSTLMRTTIKITGAGRTDTGVNARMMIAHFDLESPIDDREEMVRRLNSITGPAIAIENIAPVHHDAHARFDAVSRTYHYYAITSKSPFFNQLSWRAPKNLNFGEMNRAARLLLTTKDFTSFAKLHSDARTNICHVSEAVWEELGEGIWCFKITADRFLRNMVRAIVGTLVDIGRGKLTVDGFRKVIESKDRCSAGTSMAAHALFLWEIKYPYPINGTGEMQTNLKQS